MISLIIAGMLLCSCGTEKQPAVDSRAAEAESFAKGADVSWLTQMEKEGYTFKTVSGQEKECMTLLKEDCGVNSIRLRVWVDPKDGWNNIDDVLVKARRAHALGLRLMIDFHFSDTWADPGHQLTPEAWKSFDLKQLKDAVAGHVTETLSKLKLFGISPEWVQIGNETRAGFMLPLGSIENGSNFAQLVNAGYDAVKSVCPMSKVIIHLDGGNMMWLYTYVFDNLRKNGGKFDMVGMSLYPDKTNWMEQSNDVISNIGTIWKNYGVPTMLCEIGFNYDEAEACKDCISYLMRLGKATGHFEGIFYWEPQSPVGYNGGYSKGCFVNGTPTCALDAFLQ